MPGRYRSLSGSLRSDAEKQRRDSYDSNASAPSLISPDGPLLSTSTSPPRKNYALRYHLPRRRFSRYFTLALVSTLLLFALYLIRSSWASEAEVRLGLKKTPPPPPVWEQFPFLKRYHGGVRTLVGRAENVPEYPPGKDDREREIEMLRKEAMERKKEEDRVEEGDTGFGRRKGKRAAGWPAKGVRFDPFGARDGKEGEEARLWQPRVKCYLDNRTKLEIPQLVAYPGVPQGFPEPVMGSYDVLGLRDDVCFERYGRLGPYGFGYSRKFGGSGAGMEGEKTGSEEVWGEQLEVDYRGVRWADVQEQCVQANAHRFRAAPKALNHFFTSMGEGGPQKDINNDAEKEEMEKKLGPHGKRLIPRTAVIIRTWWDYHYDAEDLFYLRALINELSIQSGAEYTVHFLIHVKDDNMQIWADAATYDRVLRESLPPEFAGMGTLWSERQMGLIYGGVAESFYRDLPVHGAYRSTYMPVQYFAHMHPEYDFFWHWEMDIRYTGHFYHLFSRVGAWAKQQPRKGLWERSGRFYVPAEHGSWEDFRQMVRVQSEHGTAHKESMYEKMGSGDSNNGVTPATKPIWGPVHPTGEGDRVFDPDADPQPPSSYDKDNYEWGVGEDADLITFNPLFDPHHTNWILAEDVTGYNTTDGNFPPRRTAIITASRLSARLLRTMHAETTFQRHTMFSEMWPGSMALQHGYKAVYAPHPVYIDRRWPPSYLAAVFNNGLHGAAGGARTSVFSDERQHNFLGTTWYYHAGFSPNLWKRWLGYRVDGDGGEEEEVSVSGEGRMCVPAMLLHPVKQVDLVFEHQVGEE